jgi:malonyl-CoA/methylmalonyl-CoA synthetase
MRAPTTTLETIEGIACWEPDRPALREDGNELTYGQLSGLLRQCGRELQRLGVRHGQRVAVSGPGFGIQLLLLLASEAIGAVTLSFQAEGDPDAAFLFGQVDWVFSARPQATPATARFVPIDAAFLAALRRPLQDAPPLPWTPADLQEPARISRTSGSSGASKFMVLRRHVQENWVRSPFDLARFHRDMRLLMLGPLVINAVYGRSCCCLRLGGLLLVGGEGGAIAELAPSHIYGLPVQLQRLVDGLPPGYAAPAPVTVASTGGLMPAVLRERVRALFGGRVLNRYGSNEIGAVCEDLDPDGTGWITPGADIAILGDDGKALPPGEAGMIAMRTPNMADGYLARPEETAAAFRDGWFISSDVGVLVAPRRLRILGRRDDLVNIGGIKVPATKIEADLRAQPAIADAAVLAVSLPGGAGTLGVAVVLASGATPEEGGAQVQAALQLVADTSARVLFLSALPRMHTGKTDRMALLRLFRP